MIIPPQIRIAAAALALVGLLGACAFAGWRWRDRDYQAHLAADARKDARILAAARRIEASTAAMSASIRRIGDAREANYRVVYQIIERKVPEYVTNTAASRALDAAGGLPAGFVQLHNAAALGVDPDAAGSAGTFRADAATGLGLPDAAHVIAGNYQLYRICRGRLDDWDAWYARLTAAYAAAAKDAASSSNDRKD